MHTHALIRYSIIARFENLIIADQRGDEKKCFWKVANIKDIDFQNIDVVVISTLRYQQEIEEELKERNFTGQIVKFYKQGEKEFYYLKRKYERRNFFEGDFLTWEDAEAKCLDSKDTDLIERLYQSVLTVLNGYAAYELDTLPVFQKKISFHLMAWLALASVEKSHITVLDFGGSLGSTYLQNRDFIDEIPAEVTWYIVEQPYYVKRGNELFAGSNVKFRNSMDEIEEDVDIVLFSGVFMYLPNIREIVNTALKKGPEYVIVDRTYIGDRQRIVKQSVSGITDTVYSCPMKILDKKCIIEMFSEKYELKYEFPAMDEDVILDDMKAESRGFVWKKKS